MDGDMAGGAAGAFEALVARYGRLIRDAVARATRRNATLADDVEQRVKIALWRKLEGPDPTIERPATYVYRCAVREAVRAVQQEEARAAEPLNDELPAAGRAADQALRDAERARALARTVATLSEDRRRAVSAHLAGFSVEEIMELTGWSYQKARNLIARGMADLRARLEEVDLD
jgi:RNA polymerase sigma factor (sigma-70 family)